MRTLVPRTLPHTLAIHACTAWHTHCGHERADLTMPAMVHTSAALALVFNYKIGVVAENIFNAMFTDRLVVKGTMLDVVTVFFQVQCRSTHSGYLL